MELFGKYLEKFFDTKENNKNYHMAIKLITDKTFLSLWFLNEIICKLSYVSETIQTIHQLPCFVGHLVYRLENCCIVRTTFAQCVAQGTHHGKIAIRIIHGSYVFKSSNDVKSKP